MNTLPWFLSKDSQYIYTSGRYLCFDFETTNLDKGSALNPDNHPVLACWRIVEKDGSYKDYECWGDEYAQHQLIRDCYDVDFIVAHNAKFDLQYLSRCGIDLRKILPADTMLAQWVLDGNLGNLVTRSLDNLADTYRLGRKGNLVSTLIKQGVCPSTIRKDWLLKYCKQDVHLTHLLFMEQVKRLQNKNLLHIFHTRNLTCTVLADIETNGMTLDKDRVHAEYRQTLADKIAAEQKLNILTGGINLNSPKQVAEYLYDTLKFKPIKDFKGNTKTTKTGNRPTDSATISQLKATTDKQKQFVDTYREYNKLESLLSKNLLFFEKVCNERDGTFYGLFNQGVTKTHRLSASGRPLVFKDEKKSRSVQFQNMPRQYKSLFWSGDEDWLIGECDGSQLEFRVAADLGNDPVAYDEICNKTDVHSITANTLTAAGQPTNRQQAKASTFAPLYGGMGKTKAEQEYCKFFKEKYEGVSNTQFQWSMIVAMGKELILPYGMRYYWPDAKIVGKGRVNKSTEIYNFPVQGLATAEIIPIALVHFWHRIKDEPIVILNTIHDSIICKVHKDAVDTYCTIAKQSLTTDVYKYLDEVYSYSFKVPLGLGVKLSRNWSDTKQERTWSVFPDGTEYFEEK